MLEHVILTRPKQRGGRLLRALLSNGVVREEPANQKAILAICHCYWLRLDKVTSSGEPRESSDNPDILKQVFL